MCDPISALILGGTKLASTYMQGQASKAIDNRRKNIINDTNALNNQRTADARQDYSKSFDASTPAGMAAAADAARLARTADYQGVIGNSQPAVITDNASDAAKRAIITALTNADASARDLAARRAAAEAYGASVGSRNIAQNHASANIGIQTDAINGNDNVAQFQLSQADRAGQKWANLAGLTDAIGTIAGGIYNAPSAPGTNITWNNTPGFNIVSKPTSYYGPGF